MATVRLPGTTGTPNQAVPLLLLLAFGGLPLLSVTAEIAVLSPIEDSVVNQNLVTVSGNATALDQPWLDSGEGFLDGDVGNLTYDPVNGVVSVDPKVGAFVKEPDPLATTCNSTGGPNAINLVDSVQPIAGGGYVIYGTETDYSSGLSATRLWSIDDDRTTVTGQCIVELPEVFQGSTQVVVRVCGVWFDLYRGAKAGHRIVELPEVLQGIAQIAICFGVAGVELQCAAVTGHCIVELPEAFLDYTQIEMRFGIIGHEFRSLLKSRKGILALHLQGSTQQFPGKTGTRILPGQCARPAFQFRITPGVEQGDERVEFGRGGRRSAGRDFPLATMLVLLPAAAAARIVSSWLHLHRCWINWLSGLWAA